MTQEDPMAQDPTDELVRSLESSSLEPGDGWLKQAADRLEAASAIAAEAAKLLEFIPPEVSPVVVTRDRLAGLQAAVDNFRDLEPQAEADEAEAPA
jgi:hypothetical protein